MLRVLALGWRSLGVHRRAGLKPVRTYVRRSIRPPWRGRCTSREVGARRRPAPGAGTIGPPLPPPGEARALGQDVREGWSAGRRRQCRSLPLSSRLSWEAGLSKSKSRVRIGPNHDTLRNASPASARTSLSSCGAVQWTSHAMLITGVCGSRAGVRASKSATDIPDCSTPLERLEGKGNRLVQVVSPRPLCHGTCHGARNQYAGHHP